MSYEHICPEARFLKDVAEHEMIVIRDDGVHRHIRFQKPGTYCMHFDLITWPGYLCYTGDMGTYVFSRLDDMFEFFRTDREHQRLRDGRTLAINPGYWGEKLQAVERCGDDGRYREFSEDKFARAVIGDLVEWVRSHAYETTKEERRELWDAVVSDVIGADGDSGGYRKQCAAHDFNHRVNRRVEFYFQDFWENNVMDYTHGFIWCCYALAWGVAKYDEAKGSPE
ncbi:MAG: hypothetical protein PHD19_11755 [Dechloromonas sp.]|nr:hypothetical protein [Dechloromonas sp.]